ncbi:hypothetical protein [Streptomyces sp. NPDC050504]|uniref:hypothetical protein n=1 Tax=Streptomyces sp. NPDC050504 TaxID=3365618 RepID=UPI00378A3681
MTTGIRTARARLRLGLGAFASALVVALLPLPTTPAQAAPAEAAGPAGSAVTVTGRKGPYDDFSTLKVTVHQTRQLRAQGVRISWTGGAPSEGFDRNYLQIMQCWGDDPAGPKREQCQFGGSGVAQGGNWTGLRQLGGADPAEKEYKDNGEGESYVPFRPADGSKPTTGSRDWTYFSSLDTNEEPYAVTHADGTGEFTIPLQTDRESNHLGCGARPGKPCWLVVVPRGTHDPDGSTGPGHTLQTSPLSTSNWAQRLVVRLDFLPVDGACAADRKERRIIGSELVTDAVSSWQPALCSAPGGAKYAFSQSGEETARQQIATPSPTAPGLGFTVDPVEAPDGGAPLVHAPVAVSGLVVGFFVELPDAGQLRSMRLTPRLMAKLLTSSYQKDVSRSRRDVPPHVADNPASLFHDPEFKELNPAFKDWLPTQQPPMGLMVQLENSDTTKVVWNWLRSDAEAKAFLAGSADPWGMKVNPYFKELKLDTDTALSDFPKADPTRTTLTLGEEKVEYGTTEIAPYVQDMHEGALRTRRGNNGATITIAAAGNGTPAKLVNTPPLSGQRMVLAVVDAASAARYGLQTAALRSADGSFVTATTASLLKGVAAMRPVRGVLAPAPGAAKGGAYPLTTVAYAAASTGLPAAERADYARLMRYAAGPGQTPGTAQGQLPPGYAPLPAALRTQALAAADRLKRGNPAGPGDGADSAGTASGGGSGQGGASGQGGGTGTGGAGGADGGTGSGGAASAGPAAADAGAGAGTAGGGKGGSGETKQNVAASGGLTPSTVLGVVRWVLLGVLVTGGAAALSGPVLLRLSARRGNSAAVAENP